MPLTISHAWVHAGGVSREIRPWLTDHVRRHQLFVHMVRQQRGSSDRQGSEDVAQLQQAPSSELLRSDSGRVLGRKPTRPAELPVYSKGAKIGYS